jgi:hypothetical protein
MKITMRIMLSKPKQNERLNLLTELDVPTQYVKA